MPNDTWTGNKLPKGSDGLLAHYVSAMVQHHANGAAHIIIQFLTANQSTDPRMPQWLYYRDSILSKLMMMRSIATEHLYHIKYFAVRCICIVYH
jgi:hypothetical protein